MRYPKYSRAFEVVAELPEPLRALKKLAYNFRWTWHHGTRDLYREIDRQLWEDVDHNPVQLLARLPQARIQKLAKDAGFLAKLRLCEEDLDGYLAAETWFGQQQNLPESLSIAYFCAEFGISESLPIYSGGLGVLAGDHLKAASDLGLPLVGVGLLYSRGYFRQSLSADGWQQERYPEYDFYQMPLRLVRGQDEQPLHIQVELPDRIVTCQVWRADVGRIALYLLDSNVLENEATDQGITDTLYGGDEEMRIRQEVILGIGGMRALQAIGIRPTVCHMNEGHAAFLSIERIRQFMQENDADFRTARQVTVNGNVFTTHTPVPAGFDLFTAELLDKYAKPAAESVGLPFQTFVKMGRIDPENEGEAFNMAVLAMENANHVNGVSKLHARVTRSMFHQRWPEYPEDEAPVGAVTNGIHTETWISQRMSELLDQYLGKDWRDSREEVWNGVQNIPDADLWELLENQRGDLVRFIRKRLQKDMERRNMGRVDPGVVSSILDPRVLTIGFARRFATYKRASLVLADRERLKSLLYHSERPVQIVFAGKSHPRDDGGKKLMQDIFNFINHEGARTRMVFVEDYDMRVARMMVQGVDLWLNNPRRPMEASGTSGMKVVPNGGLNCSVLDGWWDEGYDPGVGWAIGDREEAPDQEQQDWLDSRRLYQLIEQEIAPKFYHRVDGGIPSAWLEMVKRSMAQLAPVFSTTRMVREYAEKAYFPAGIAFERMRSDGLQRAKDALTWRDRVRSQWQQVRIADVSDTAGAVNPLGEDFTVRARVQLGSITPDEVRVQAVFGKIGPNRDLLNMQPYDMHLVGEEDGAHLFETSLSFTDAGHRGYTIRVLPKNEDVNVASELPLVAWEEAAVG
jgi:glycogen phosphorylase